ncbi:hypothetical protein SteCoe_28357 [Stentor coeruleus]|uniref:PX domain-containing protein n=1 Tax=Stentor coeruleus TaxID=5963 RepID=A0A1R2B8Q1_9CILI|nr:hypothetical protein SteCoe_28357 [Stentor coeruleus]
MYLTTGVFKMIKHWKDGKEVTKYHATRFFLKIIACISCSALEMVHIIDISPRNYYSTAHQLFRTCYFGFSAITWLFSAFMVYFEYKRHIKCQWIGQKGYWLFSLFSNTTLLILNIFTNSFVLTNTELKTYIMIQTIIYSFMIFSNIVLSYFAIFKPNDFIIMHTDLLTKICPEKEEKDCCGLSVSVSGFKFKDQTTYYEIVVSALNNTSIISKTLLQFENFHKKLEENHSPDTFPDFEMPELPKDLKMMNPAEKVSVIDEYLNKLCQQNYFVDAFLDFLEVKGKIKETILKSVLKTYDEEHDDSIIRSKSEVHNYYEPKSMVKDTIVMSIPAYHLNWIVDIQITSWLRSDTHIEYSIKTEIRILSFESWTTSRYSEMLNLHKQLQKYHIPLSSFPPKSIHNFRSMDSEAIELRRVQLEEYLGTIFNDPAYLHPFSLKFINCNLDIEKLYKIIPQSSVYELIAPLKWEGELGSDSKHFIMYVMKFRKSILGKSQDWEIRRRFKEFDALHKVLQLRSTSFLLREYLKNEPPPLPQLPGKSIAPLSTYDEINERKQELEKYIIDLLMNPSVTCCYYFRNFIGEIE